MANTLNYGFPKPDTAKNIDEEFYVFRDTTLDMIDAAIKAVADAAAGKSAIGHGHAIGDIAGLGAALESKMPASQTFSLDSLTDVDGAGAAANGQVLWKTSAGWQPTSALAALGPHGHLISEITGLVDALAGKSAVGHAHVIADVTGLATALAGRVSKTGDTMTGVLNIDYTNATIEIKGDNREWYWQAFENGSSPYFRLVDRNANAEAFRVGTDGSLWCRQLGDINTRIEARAAAYASSASHVAEATKGIPTGNVGSYVFARYSGGVTPVPQGTIVGGAELTYSNADGTGGYGGLSGSWRLMGVVNTATNAGRTSLFLRVA